MVYFPQTPLPLLGYSSWQEEYVLRSSPRAGTGQIKDLLGRTQFFANASYDHRKSDALIVNGFWKQFRSSQFFFIDFEIDVYYGMALGVGNGATTTFTIPAKNTSARTVYVNGVAKTTPTQYTVTVGFGVGGEDAIVFTAGNIPTAGQLITIDCTGNGRFLCEFIQRPEKSSPSGNRIALKIAVAEIVRF